MDTPRSCHAELPETAYSLEKPSSVCGYTTQRCHVGTGTTEVNSAVISGPQNAELLMFDRHRMSLSGQFPRLHLSSHTGTAKLPLLALSILSHPPPPLLFWHSSAFLYRTV